MSEESDVLKRGVSIVSVIESTTGWHFRGSDMARCRECVEHDSLKVWPQTNSWYWYSRGVGGDVFDWIKLAEGVAFDEAVQIVAQGDYRPLAPLSYMPAPSPPMTPLRPDLYLSYHRALDQGARTWWHGQGAGDEAISRFYLGLCEYHEIWRQPTYTIPVIVDGQCVNVRHRLMYPPATGNKYRPERAGLPTELFNRDILTPELGGVIIVAGEKKAIVMWQYGLPAISSTAGCGHWDDAWTARLQFCRKVFIAFDPGEGQAALALAERLGDARVHLVDLPEKPDDYLIHVTQEQGAAAAEAQFRQYLRQARPFTQHEVWARRSTGGKTWGKMRDLR